MSTTTTPARVTITTVEPAELRRPDKILDGLGDSTFEALRFPEIDAIFAARPNDDAEPAYETKFDREVIDAALLEVQPVFIALLAEAVRKRLPWTWEGEEMYRCR